MLPPPRQLSLSLTLVRDALGRPKYFLCSLLPNTPAESPSSSPVPGPHPSVLSSGDDAPGTLSGGPGLPPSAAAPPAAAALCLSPTKSAGTATITGAGEGTIEGGGGAVGDAGDAVAAGAALPSASDNGDGNGDRVGYGVDAVPDETAVDEAAAAEAAAAAAAVEAAESGINNGCGSDSDVGSTMMSSSEVVELVGLFENNRAGGGGATSESGSGAKVVAASTFQLEDGTVSAGVEIM